ncbi:dTMP kinase [Allobaculum stercoricanis]|uniref:dTMP kinase n=1 Tax=Allobaculum stercoricanis TaxID=174709 RepID=UPI00036022DA|nr:dTMP kinase [Allobaculum stercoricanis]
MNQTKGMLITFEGNDGAGKTTALESVAAILKEKGYPIVVSREPGGSVLAEKIRELILDVNNEMDAKTEAYLYAASRREHLVQTILPALQEGKLILCDRYLDSSLAYQGHGRKLGQKEIEQLNDFGLEGFRPDYTLFFSLDLETEKERMEMRGEMNRLDLESREFHQRVRDGFTCLCQQNPQRIHVIDASQTKEEVAQATLAQVEELWKGRFHD